MFLKPPKFSYPIKGHPLARGLVGCWLMNEGSGIKVFDSSGNRNTGTLLNSIVWSPGWFGSCLYSDASSGRVSIGDTPSLDILGSITVSVWIKQLGAHQGGFGVIVSKRELSVANSYEMIVAGDDVRFIIDTSTSAYSQAIDIPLNVWYHFVGTWNQATISLYQNGILVDSDAKTGSMSNVTTSFTIGGTNIPNYSFNGLIDNVQIWNRALSASEIAQLYREPFAMFGRRQIWQSGAGAPPAFKPYWARQCNNLIGAA
jgi:hypothetical protein